MTSFVDRDLSRSVHWRLSVLLGTLLLKPALYASVDTDLLLLYTVVAVFFTRDDLVLVVLFDAVTLDLLDRSLVVASTQVDLFLVLSGASLGLVDPLLHLSS